MNKNSLKIINQNMIILALILMTLMLRFYLQLKIITIIQHIINKMYQQEVYKETHRYLNNKTNNNNKIYNNLN